MAFQTNVLRNGQWVTETVNFEDAIKASASPKSAMKTSQQPPKCGVLSRTMVESPIVHWILPVRLRSEAHNDIAFVGDHFVQINELRRDGQTHEVLRKSDFDSRIRGAVVLGNSVHHGLDDDDQGKGIKPEETDTLMEDIVDARESSQSHTLPPQLLVLMLESGDILFLILRQSQDSGLEFFLSKRKSIRNLSYLGYHLSIDPSSRYMAAASPDGILVMYELESMQKIHEEYSQHRLFDPVKSTRIRAIQGTIHQLTFLYPRPGDDHHVILHLIVVKMERNSAEPVSRMITYEWELGDSLDEVFAEEKVGTRLPREHRMPSLLIPLRFDTAFFAVSQPDIGIVKNCLSGSPVFEILETDAPGRTSLHHGADRPLWTAWSRPFRRKKYFEKTDIIYLAREDGAVIHVEIDAPELVPSVTNVGCLDTNINTAFTAAYDIFSDILIIGGDSGPGGIWKLAPRTELEQVSVLPNWSPVIDMATYDWRPAKNASPTEHRVAPSRRPGSSNMPTKMQSLYTASGRGVKGNLTQWRWGIQGRIGLDIESGEPIRRSWAFLTKENDNLTLYGLLSLPNSSTVLRFSSDFGQVDALDQDSTGFDLSTRTLHAAQSHSGRVIQVTETTISLIGNPKPSRHSLENILGMTGIVAENAYCTGNAVVLSTHKGGISRLHTLRHEAMDLRPVGTWEIAGEVTCVTLVMISSQEFVVIGSVVNRTTWISVCTLDGAAVTTSALLKEPGDQSTQDTSTNASSFEPLTSLCVVRESAGVVDVVGGTRCGHVVNVRVSVQTPGQISWNSVALGVSPVDVLQTNAPFDNGIGAIACCDNNLIMMSDFSESRAAFKKKSWIWLTDSNDSSMPSPPIHSAFSLGVSLSGYAGHISLMLLSGSRLLFADIWPHVALVPRSLSLNGTPSRVIFSETWNCFIVALLQDDRPTLAFIDPDTGLCIASASDKDRNDSEFISGLGHSGDRIYGLSEWLYVKDGKTFAFLLVATKDGRLLIVSVTKTESRQGDGGGRGLQLQYWTRYKKVLGKPIYSIVGEDDGIIFCVDKTIHWEVLDLAEKKLRPMKRYELDSPAVSLRVSNGKILVLTIMHSLEVVDHRAGAGDQMELMHTDSVSRTTTHMIDIGFDDNGSQNSQWPVTMLSDHRGGFAGVWVPWGQRNKEFQSIFESRLPTSVRRFAQVRSRPQWLSSESRNRYGVIRSSEEGGEVFGVSLDGALRHFRLIDIDLWRFLSLVQNLAQRSLAIKSTNAPLSDNESMAVDDDDGDDFDIEPRIHPKLMHIDGDLLERCLNGRMLERIVGTEDGLDLFREYLDGLEGGRWTETFRDGVGNSEEDRQKAYFKLGYEVLEYLQLPVL